jgi:tRNA 2-thiouridine synthesizing protein A
MAGTLAEHATSLPKDGVTLALICGTGYRSTVAASILERTGFSNLVNVTGGMAAWVKAGYSVSRETALAVDTVPPAGGAGIVVDCRGLSCPWPSMKLAKAIVDVPPGGRLEVLATDPGAHADLDAFTRRNGHTIVERSESQGVQRFLVQRAR